MLTTFAIVSAAALIVTRWACRQVDEFFGGVTIITREQHHAARS